MKKIILDICGATGSWSRPYKKAGYDVRIITLPKDDVIFYHPPKNVYGILAAPPCNKFSFARTNAKKERDLENAIAIAKSCLRIIWTCQYQIKSDNQKAPPLKFWALENPKGMLEWFLGKPKFEFNPYDFGDNYKKRTQIWGWFKEPKKTPIKCTMPKFDKLKTKQIHPEQYGKLTRQERRAITPQGFAKAFFEANR